MLLGGVLQNWLISAAVQFALRQVAKFRDGVDWPTVRRDLEARVRDLVPREWLDDEAVAAMDIALECVKEVLASTADLETILTKLAESDWQGALNAVVALAKRIAGMPQTPAATVTKLKRFASIVDPTDSVAAAA